MVDSMLTIVKPDFIQVDCKGHPGITSFPATVGTPATSFAKDPLRIFSDVTKKHGVALYVHYSGVKDIEAIRKHPQWARVNEDGSRDPENTSVHSAYNDSLLIPQLREAITKYRINGAWVDGDCWATAPDYSEASLKNTSSRPAKNQFLHPRKRLTLHSCNSAEGHFWNMFSIIRRHYIKPIRASRLPAIGPTHPLCRNRLMWM